MIPQGEVGRGLLQGGYDLSFYPGVEQVKLLSDHLNKGYTARTGRNNRPSAGQSPNPTRRLPGWGKAALWPEKVRGVHLPGEPLRSPPAVISGHPAALRSNSWPRKWSSHPPATSDSKRSGRRNWRTQLYSIGMLTGPQIRIPSRTGGPYECWFPVPIPWPRPAWPAAGYGLPPG